MGSRLGSKQAGASPDIFPSQWLAKSARLLMSRVFLPTGAGTPDEKFFGNFPYPYMNGMLHLGHAFSLSKVSPA